MNRFGGSLAAALLLLLVLAGDALAQVEIRARAATFTLGGRLHMQYRHDSPEGAQLDDFFVRRARIQADVKVSDFFDARLQPDFAGGETALQDAWVRFNFTPAFRVSMGQFQRAHEGFEQTSSTELPVIERDGRVSGVPGCAGVGGACSLGRLVARLGYAGRDAGVRVEGRVGGSVAYEATVTNGTGVNVSDENDAKSVSGRLTWAASEGVALSAFYGVHDHPGLVDPDDTDYGAAGGIDVVVGDFRQGFRLQASAVQGDNWQAGPGTTFRTAQALASWYHPLDGGRIAGWEPVLRVSLADPDSDVDDDGGLLVTPGFNLYVTGRNRVGVNVDVYDPASGDSAWSLKVQSFLYF